MPILSSIKHQLARAKRLGMRIKRKWEPAPAPEIRSSAGKGGYRFLLFAYCDPSGINTIKEAVYELIENSQFRIDFYNMYPSLVLHPNFEFHHYDGLIIHNTLNYSIENLRNLDRSCKQKIADFPGIKIMFKQDEHHRQNLLIDYLEKIPYDLIVTICDDTNVRQFYPEDRLPNLRFLNYLTGYVKDSYKQLPYKSIHNRSIDVGYRGSIQPLTAGRLCYEKRQIGWAFEPYAKRRGLATDISSRWEDRFMGDAWYDFLGRCKATLGIESGASIVDLNGSVEHDYTAYVKQHPRAKDEEVLAHLAKYESGPQYRAISPRHFEAAACFTAQVMYEGRFQDIFLPDLHYIPLKRDFSNVEEVIDKLMDDQYRAILTQRAYEEIICNPAYSYESFVCRFDAQVEEILQERH